MSTTSRVVGERKACADCGQYKELRPYGKGGAWVCFKCAMKDEAEERRQFDKVLSADISIIDATLTGESPDEIEAKP